VLIGNTPTDPGRFNSVVVIPAGQRLSRTFYVIGGQVGTGNLYYSGGGYNALPTTGTVTQTAFVFQEAVQGQTVSVTNGSTATLTVLPALSPLGTAGLAPLAIRGGLQPIVVNVTSSDTKVLTVTTPQITLKPGDQQVAVTVRGAAPGTATLTLSGTGYDFGTSQSSVKVTVK
jgi:hypothetical protein